MSQQANHHPTGRPSADNALPKLYLLLENPRKSNNLGPLLRCAAAFGISTVVAIGYDKCSTEGSHGAAKHIQIIAFPTAKQAATYLKRPISEGGCGCTSIVGILGCVADDSGEKIFSVCSDVESGLAKASEDHRETTTQRSVPVHTRPFLEGNCCFAVSKDWSGLPVALAEQCDSFIHVPHKTIRREDGASSFRLLDAPSTVSIVLHHYTAWAQYDERGFQGQKFDVTRQRVTGPNREVQQLREEARRLRQQERDETSSSRPLSGMFNDPNDDGDY